MKKNKKRKQKQRQRNIRKQKKLNNQKKKRKAQQHSKNNKNFNSFGFLDQRNNEVRRDTIPAPKRNNNRLRSGKPRRDSFFRDLFNFFDPFENDDYFDLNDNHQSSLFNENYYGRTIYQFDRDNYLEKMYEYADQNWRETEHIQYEAQISDYNNMSDGQLHYYFYWRSQARKGNYLSASYGYFILYFVELLNMLGLDTPEETLPKLVDLFKTMANGTNYFVLTEDGLDYLASSIFDFAYFHNLNIFSLDPIVWLYLNSRERLITALNLFSKSEDQMIPANILMNFSDIDLLKKSQIYKDNRNLYNEVISNIFFVLDSISKRENKNGFLNAGKFNNKTIRRITFDPFVNFVVDEQTYEKKYERSNISIKRFNEYFSGIIQEIENTLRNVYGQRGRLRKFEVDGWAKNIINNFITEKYKPETSQDHSGNLKLAKEFLEEFYPERKIEIDSSKLEMLRKETEVVQDLMDISTNEEISNENNHLIYLDSLAQVLSNLSKSEPSSIGLFSSLVESNNSPIKNGKISDTILDVSKRYLNQPFIINNENGITINNEYFNGVKYLFDNIDNYPFLNIKEQEFNSVNEEVLNFIESLDEIQQEFIKVLVKTQNPGPELEELAINAMSMVELIFDDINNKALLYLDDIVLEMDDNNTPYIIDEYTEMINKIYEEE